MVLPQRTFVQSPTIDRQALNIVHVSDHINNIYKYIYINIYMYINIYIIYINIYNKYIASCGKYNVIKSVA